MNQTNQDVKLIVKNSYDQIAQQYLEWALPRPSRRNVYIEELFAHLGSATLEKAVILELGCGAGVPTGVLLASRCGRLVANDISGTQLELAEKHFREASIFHKVELVESDMTSLTFPEFDFDAIVAFFSIIHLPLEDQPAVLRKFYSWLKFGGYLICNFAAEANQGAKIGEWFGTPTFWSGFGAEKSIALLQETGFEVVEREVIKDVVDDAEFLWVIAKKTEKGP